MKIAAVIGLVVLLAMGSVAVVGAAEGEKVTVTGEVVDTYCYTLMGAKGMSHKQCAIDCAKKGIPVGLLEKGTNNLYILLPNKDKAPVPEAAINKCGEEGTVITGKKYVAHGISFLTVESVK